MNNSHSPVCPSCQHQDRQWADGLDFDDAVPNKAFGSPGSTWETDCPACGAGIEVSRASDGTFSTSPT